MYLYILPFFNIFLFGTVTSTDRFFFFCRFTLAKSGLFFFDRSIHLSHIPFFFFSL